MKDRFQGFSPFMQLIVLILIGAVSFILLSMLIALITSSLYPSMPLDDIMIQQKSFPVQFMMMYYFPFQVGFLLIPGILYGLWSDSNLKLRKVNFKGISWSVLLFVSIFLLLPFFSEINIWFTESVGVFKELEQQKMVSDAQMSELLGSTSDLSFWIGALIIGVITGISEEFAFRRLLFGHMLSYTKQLWVSLIGSAFIFAILHFNYLQFLPLFTFGLALGMIYYFSGNIWTGVILHGLNNIINLWWLSTDSFPTWMENIDPKTTIPSTLLLMGLLYYQFFRKRTTT